MDAKQLRASRLAAGISATMLAARAQCDRARLSHIENGYVQPTGREIDHLHEVLNKLIDAKRRVAAAAVEYGWPVSAI